MLPVSHKKPNKMSTLVRKRRANIWIHFTFDVKGKKTLYKLCGATPTGKNTTNFYTLEFSQLDQI